MIIAATKYERLSSELKSQLMASEANSCPIGFAVVNYCALKISVRGFWPEE